MNKCYILGSTLLVLSLVGCASKNDEINIETVSVNNQEYSIETQEIVKVQATPTPTIIPTPIFKEPISVNEISEASVSENDTAEETEEELVIEEEPNLQFSENVVYDIIIDTDYASDVDDVAAVKVGVQMDRQGLISLKALATSAEGDYVCRAAHGQLSYEGYNTLPVGMARRGIEDEGPHWDHFVTRLNDQATYQLIDAVDMYKNILMDSYNNNRRIRIVVLGFMVNIQDIIMDAECYDLMSKCVDSIWIDGGAYPMSGRDFNFFWTEDCIASIQYAIANSPVPLVFITNETGCNYETGVCVNCGKDLMRIDPDLSEPVNIAYRKMEESDGADLSGGHYAWDALAVWAAGLSREQSMTKLTPVDAYVSDDGTNTFILNPNGRHYIVERTNYDVNWYSQQLDDILKFNMQ